MDPLKNWLLHTSLPVWLAHGVDRHAGGFHESLSPGSFVCTAPFRRLRVAARQTYVFARAHTAGLAGADAATEIGMDFLRRRAALPEGGYAVRFGLDGHPTDTTRDLYDHAFVLLAFATAANILPDAPLRRDALALMAFINTAFAHNAGGFVESLPPALPRRQNPHMHLLEAALAAHQAFGDPVFLQTARDLVELCLTKFLHPTSGGLLEFFADDLRPATGDAQQIEPGHCCEWIWLLQCYQAATRPDPRVAAVVHSLADVVQRHGIHPATGDLIDAASETGEPIASTARLWPQTERLKAAKWADTAEQARAAARLATWLRPDGLWVERRDESGKDLLGTAPASSLYHLTCALLPAKQEGLLF